MEVRELITDKALPLIPAEKSVSDALDMMTEQDVRGVLIMVDGQMEGIFTAQDFMRCYLKFPGLDIRQIRVSAVMTTELLVVKSRETIEQAMSMMIQARIRHLPVMKGRKVVGLLGLEDLARSHVGALTQELHYLKDYIADLQDAAND